MTMDGSRAYGKRLSSPWLALSCHSPSWKTLSKLTSRLEIHEPVAGVLIELPEHSLDHPDLAINYIVPNPDLGRSSGNLVPWFCQSARLWVNTTC